MFRLPSMRIKLTICQTITIELSKQKSIDVYNEKITQKKKTSTYRHPKWQNNWSRKQRHTFDKSTNIHLPLRRTSPFFITKRLFFLLVLLLHFALNFYHFATCFALIITVNHLSWIAHKNLPNPKPLTNLLFYLMIELYNVSHLIDRLFT